MKREKIGPRRAHRNQSGQSTVELALFAPIFILALLASVTVIDLVAKKITVTRLAALGAREVIANENRDFQGLEEELRRALKRVDPTADDRLLSVRLEELNGSAFYGDRTETGQPVRVDVKYVVKPPLFGSMLSGGGIEAGDSVVARQPLR